MFNKNFYPTPRHVIDRMGIDCRDKVCLEPSAGKGDIVDYLKEFGAKDVIACEKNKDLVHLVNRKCQVIERDFFDVDKEDISHVDLIVMNPPFFEADKHILHAWEIAPEGCEIVALCNHDTLTNRHSLKRKSLSGIVEEYGNSENLGDCFSEAERKTNVEVGLIHVFKPVISESFNFEGFYFENEIDPGISCIMPYNEIRAIVNSYVSAVKLFDKFETVASEMHQYTKITGFGSGFSFDTYHGYGGERRITNKTQFSKSMQKHCWRHVFDKMGVEKYVTKGVMEDINRFVEKQQQYPFTMRNIYRMIEIIIGTRENTMSKAIVEAVDNFTRYTHENRFHVEGWKTNSGHMLNEKFICNRICSMSFGGQGLIFDYSSRVNQIVDLQKALCFISGTNYDDIPEYFEAGLTTTERRVLKEFDRLPEWQQKEIRSSGSAPKSEGRFLERNVWYDWGFFEFKVFKKGSGHFRFKDKKVWERLNRSYAKAKGEVLPERF